MARGHPRDARVERIEQRRVALALRLLDPHVEGRAHHETLELRLHHPVRAARSRQAQLVATLCRHPPSSSFTSTAKRPMNIGFRVLVEAYLTPDYTKFNTLGRLPTMSELVKSKRFFVH